MSSEAVNQFFQKIDEDRQLQQEFASALKAENNRQTTMELANRYGYQGTSDELWGEIQNIQSEFQSKLDSGEVSEKELEAIAGGGWTGAAKFAAKHLAAPAATIAGAITTGLILDK
jgi:hypothetical protein